MRSVLGRAHAKPRDRWADGVKAVSRRRRGRVSASLEAGRSPVYSTQLLPGVHDLLVTVAHAIAEKHLSANLAPAKGCQNHTASPSASSAARQSAPTRPPHPALHVS